MKMVESRLIYLLLLGCFGSACALVASNPKGLHELSEACRLQVSNDQEELKPTVLSVCYMNL